MQSVAHKHHANAYRQNEITEVNNASELMAALYASGLTIQTINFLPFSKAKSFEKISTQLVLKRKLSTIINMDS